jgi:hypothetical protein
MVSCSPTLEETSKILEEYEKEIWNDLKKQGIRQKRYLKAIKKTITQYKYSQLINFLSDCGDWFIKGIVRKHKVKGKLQQEEIWFKHVFIRQWSGVCEDDYSGRIFIPLDKEEKHFLHITYQC